MNDNCPQPTQHYGEIVIIIMMMIIKTMMNTIVDFFLFWKIGSAVLIEYHGLGDGGGFLYMWEGDVRRSLFFSLLFVQCIHYSGCRCIHIFVFFFFIIIPMFISTHIEFIWQMSKKRGR